MLSMFSITELYPHLSIFNFWTGKKCQMHEWRNWFLHYVSCCLGKCLQNNKVSFVNRINGIEDCQADEGFRVGRLKCHISYLEFILHLVQGSTNYGLWAKSTRWHRFFLWLSFCLIAEVSNSDRNDSRHLPTKPKLFAGFCKLYLLFFAKLYFAPLEQNLPTCTKSDVENLKLSAGRW